MAIEVITKEDLQEFRILLVNDFKKTLLDVVKPQPVRPWLRSKDVRKILNISAGTLFNLRVTGKLRSSKVGNLHYYRQEDIERLLENKM